MSTVTKKELIEKVANATSRPKHEVTEIIDTAIVGIKALVEGGDKVTIRGFGTFEAYRSKPTKRKPFGTGKLVEIASYLRPRFRVSDAWRNSMRRYTSE